MFQRIYIEDAVADHPKTVEILERYRRAERISCSRYGEVFNPKRQNFRIQKQAPALILAEKIGSKVLPTPPEYGLGADRHYYFSHMLNCLYDCRYCFLQGMYRSSNYLLFVNFDDFAKEIRRVSETSPDEHCFFFSGYDCDSLAMESVTGFARFILPVFRSLPNASIELRTKSVHIAPLLETEPTESIVVAFSLSPSEIAEAQEHKAPPLSSRLRAMDRLIEAGWKIGLRFDPLIYFEDWADVYARFIDQIFERIPVSSIHSITLGSFRAPNKVFNRMKRLYPEEPLFMGNLETANGLTGYRSIIESELFDAVRQRIGNHAPEELLFPCRH